MNIIIRQETEKDYNLTEKVIEKAFKNGEHSDHREQFLVAKLRKNDVFVPELSLVAEINEEIVGHIMLTKLFIKDSEKEYESLALAPVSVLPEYQNKGIGSKLIHQSLKISKEMRFKSVIVLGHDKYYPRLDLDLQVNGELKLHLTYRMNHLWHWNLKTEALMALQKRWYTLKSFLNKVLHFYLFRK